MLHMYGQVISKYKWQPIRHILNSEKVWKRQANTEGIFRTSLKQELHTYMILKISLASVWIVKFLTY